jgi:hypothetical protein
MKAINQQHRLQIFCASGKLIDYLGREEVPEECEALPPPPPLEEGRLNPPPPELEDPEEEGRLMPEFPLEEELPEL